MIILIFPYRAEKLKIVRENLHFFWNFLDNFLSKFLENYPKFQVSPNSKILSDPRKTDPQTFGEPPQPKNPARIPDGMN